MADMSTTILETKKTVEQSLQNSEEKLFCNVEFYTWANYQSDEDNL